MSRENKYLDSHFSHHGYCLKTYKHLCCNCLKSGKGYTWTCGKEGHKIISVGDRARLPSPKASKRKWLDTLRATNLNNWIPAIHPEEWGVLLTSIYKK